MKHVIAILATLVISVACASTAWAQDTQRLLPGVEPEVVLTCLINGKPDTGCHFGCANILGVVGKTSTSGFAVEHASRVEMYLRATPEREDHHIWVAYRYRAFLNPPSQEQTGFALVSSTFTCQWAGDLYGANDTSKVWRIDRFKQ